MATKKKTATSGESTETETVLHLTGRYRQALENFEAALARMNAGDAAGAREAFDRLAAEQTAEPHLADRARVYSAICARRVAPAPEPPRSAEERYHRAVMLVNSGDADSAIRVLDEALHASPNSSELLYVRASAWALKRNVESAVRDLRQAVAGDPQLRFQAANDPDFENVREEPAFIDIIEPTPTEV